MQREGSEPILPARDMQRTRAFYESLGLTAGYRDQQYEILRRDPLVVHLQVDDELDPATNGTSCYWRVADVDALYREWSSVGLPTKGIPRLTAPLDQPWGMRELALVDPSGNLVRVGTELDRLGTR